jgi:hypothetical protein
MNPNFWSKVKKGKYCWLWTGFCNDRGYGQFHVPMGDGRPINAHRFAYEELHGPVSRQLDIHHICKNKRCVNPMHLEPVTRKEHPDSAPSVQRAKTHCPQGHAYSTENTWLHPQEKSRHCRMCNRLRARARVRRTTFQQELTAMRA